MILDLNAAIAANGKMSHRKTTGQILRHILMDLQMPEIEWL